MNEEYDILAETLEFLDPTERVDFLTGRCGKDTDLFQKVNALLTKVLDEETRFGKYVVEKEIGEGGMGKVYLASFTEEYEVSDTRKTFSKKVALKTINPSQKLDSTNIRIFLNEIRTMSDLNHPNIARFYDTGTSEKGLPFFTMEYVEGMPLSKYCKEKRLSVKERLSLFSQVLEAIDYLHGRGLLHCDIKPQNVIVDLSGIPKVIDFGIASKYGSFFSDENTQSAFMQTALTLNYASPEQLKGEQNLTPATDIYSLGVVLYELLTEQLPIKYDKSSSYFQLIEIVEKEEPTALGRAVSEFGNITQPMEGTNEIWRERNCNSLSELKEQLSDELNEVVQTAINKKIKDRYSSVKEFNRHIKEYVEVSETSFFETVRKPIALLFKKTSRRFKKIPRNLKIASGIILLLGIVALTQIRSIQTLPYYFQADSTPLLTDAKSQSLTESIALIKSQVGENLKKAIVEKEARSISKIGYNEWGISQMIVGFEDSQIDAGSLNSIFDGKQAENVCWKEEISKPCNLAISGWVFLAKQRMKKKITNKQLDFILEKQSAEGWWIVFPANNDQQNAGVYVTTLLVWSLTENLQANLIDPVKKEKVVAAVKKGAIWLSQSRNKDDAENFQWIDYPFQNKYIKSYGLDGIVIHALHSVAKLPELTEIVELKNNLKEIDAKWLLNLEQNKISFDPTFVQRTFSYVHTDNGIVYDTTGHYSLPWGIVATIDVYESANTWQKAIIRKWIDNFTKNSQEGIINLTQKDADKYWVASEYLYALKYLLRK